MFSLLGLAGFFGVGGDRHWYARLPAADKARANRMAEDYASDLFDKARWQLTRSEERHIRKLVRRDFEDL